MKKKLLCLLLIAFVMMLLLMFGASASSGDYEMGDANMDGAINTRDVVLMKQSIVGITTLTEEQKQYADVIADGNVNTRDVVLVLQHIVGMDVELDGRVTVTFLNKDGSVYASHKVAKGSAFTEIPPVPTNQVSEGYEAYWNMTGVNLSAVNNDITIPYAEKLTNYTVTYHLDGGENDQSNPLSFTVETATKVLANAKKTGYTFDGWYTDPSFANKITAIEEGTAQHIELYAKFDINSYTISFVTNGGSNVDPITQNYGTSVTAPAAPQKSGFTFGGWYTDEALTSVFFFDKMPSQSITVYAKWVPSSVETYTVQFCDWDGTVLYSQIVAKGENAVLPNEAPDRDGYRFDGWQGNWENVTGNRIVLAKYVQQFEIQFLDDDGTLMDIQFLDIGDEIIAPTPSKSGYRFVGWDKSFNTAQKDLVVKAIYEKVHTVTFVGAKGQVLGKFENVYDGASVTPPTDKKIPDGFDFTDWDSDAYKEVRSDLIVTALYEIKTYTVRFLYPDGSEICKPQTVEHGSFAITPEVLPYYVRENDDGLSVFSFTKWDGDSSKITDDLDVVAIYDNPYNDPLILMKYGVNSVELYAYLPIGVSFYAWEILVGYDMQIVDGKINIDNVKMSTAGAFYVPEDNNKEDSEDTNLNDDNQYVINNNEGRFTFIWTSRDENGLTLGRFDQVLTFDLTTQAVSANSTNFTIDECKAIVGGASGFEEIVPVVVYQ